MEPRTLWLQLALTTITVGGLDQDCDKLRTCVRTLLASQAFLVCLVPSVCTFRSLLVSICLWSIGLRRRLMTRRARACLSPLPLGSSTGGSPNGSAPDLDGMGAVPATQWRTKSLIFSQSLASWTPYTLSQ